MLLLNPTNEVILGKYDRGTYIFKPNERVDIKNYYAARDLLARWSKHGLVDITWDDKLEEKYLDHELYIHDKCQEGVTNYINFLEENAEKFKMYDMECGEKKSVERLKFAKQAKELQEKIRLAFQLLEKYVNTNTKDLIRKKAEAMIQKSNDLAAKAKKLVSDNKA